MYLPRLCLVARLVCLVIVVSWLPSIGFAQEEIDVTHQRRLSFEIPGDTFTNSEVNGTYNYWLSITNAEMKTLQHSSIELVSQYSSQICDSDPKPNTTALTADQFHYTWSFGPSQRDVENGVWLGCSGKVAFTPGFDAQREVIPRIINNATVDETVRVSVTPKENAYRLRVWMSIDVGLVASAEVLQDSTIPSDAYIAPGGGSASWRIEKPTPNQLYSFTAKIHLKNPFTPEKYMYEPRISVSLVKEAPQQTRYSVSSFRVNDAVLGSITYSASEQHQWQYNFEAMDMVTLKEISVQPFVNLNIENPHQLSVVTGAVNVTASAFSSAGIISRMLLRVDNGTWYAMNLSSDTTGTAGSLVWDTGTLANGAHDIMILAVDTNEISQNRTLTVIVDNNVRRFTGYSQLLQFSAVILAVAAIVVFSWDKGRRNRS